MINFILSFFLLTTPADAGSICNDGTYSYSEGRGTCSHHGGVSVSGVYQNYNQPDTSSSELENHPRWISEYDVTKSGLPLYRVSYMGEYSVFSYTCFVIKDNMPGENIYFGVNFPNIKNSSNSFAASKESIRVFAHTNSGYKLISGSWQWTAIDQFIFIEKSNDSMESLVEPLSKTDMNNIISSDYFVISIKGQEDIIIRTPGITKKMTDTWNKCNAS
jgi:hypothetical protein